MIDRASPNPPRNGEGDRARRGGGGSSQLSKLGYRIIRIPAVEAMRNANAVAEGILARAGSPLHQTWAGPPPRPGEEI